MASDKSSISHSVIIGDKTPWSLQLSCRFIGPSNFIWQAGVDLSRSMTIANNNLLAVLYVWLYGCHYIHMYVISSKGISKCHNIKRVFCFKKYKRRKIASSHPSFTYVSSLISSAHSCDSCDSCRLACC